MTVNGQGTSSGQARTISLDGAGSSTLNSNRRDGAEWQSKNLHSDRETAALGGNNNLQNLTVSPGPLTPAFTASRTSYTSNVASTVSSVTVTATLQDTNASMMVNGQGTSSGQARTISLNGRRIQYTDPDCRDGPERESEHLHCNRESGGTRRE